MTDKSEPPQKSSSSEHSDDEEHGNTSTGDKFDRSGDFRNATINIKSTIVGAANNVRLQNLRDFTVQIRRVEDDATVGTGIAVSTDGKIVTCAHVVEAAGVNLRNSNSAEVGVGRFSGPHPRPLSHRERGVVGESKSGSRARHANEQ